MNKSIIAIAVAALAAGCAPQQPVEISANDEAKLGAELRGYAAAGPAVSCVDRRTLGDNRSAGEGAILFGGTGQRLWVNRPPGGCPDLRSDRALLTRTQGGRLCSGDIATVFEPSTGMEYGSCALGRFTPYRRAN